MEAKDKKTHILETAEELFSKKGFEAATVRDIADAAGVNLAMISYYFGSKEKMLESLFAERMSTMRLKVESLLKDEKLTPFEKVENIIESFIHKVINKQAFYKIMTCEQIMKKNPVVIKLVREMKLSYAVLFTELIKEGQKKKVFRKNIDVSLVHITMTGTVTQLMINKEYYLEYHGLEKLTEEEQVKLFTERLNKHLNTIFKSLLGYES